MEHVFAITINHKLFWNESQQKWVSPKEVFTVSLSKSLLWDLADNAADNLPDNIDGMDIDVSEIGELYE